MICAASWPNPADPHFPPTFRRRAAELITAFARRVYRDRITEESKELQDTGSKESLSTWKELADGVTFELDDDGSLEHLRTCVFNFIADFSNWDNSTVPAYLETARALMQAAHEACVLFHASLP